MLSAGDLHTSDKARFKDVFTKLHALPLLVALVQRVPLFLCVSVMEVDFEVFNPEVLPFDKARLLCLTKWAKVLIFRPEVVFLDLDMIVLLGPLHLSTLFGCPCSFVPLESSATGETLTSFSSFARPRA